MLQCVYDLLVCPFPIDKGGGGFFFTVSFVGRLVGTRAELMCPSFLMYGHDIQAAPAG